VLLALIFTLSGLASLVYQVVWQRLLTVHYGVGAVSITLIVTVFMFGLGLGGWLGGRLADRVTSRVRLYLACELGLGAFGAASPFLLDLLGRWTAGASYAWTGVLAFVFLAAPTTLMGVTLPLVVKIFHDWSGRFSATVSLLYCLNTLGAALGALLAAYVLISFWGLDGAVYVAAGVNLCLALLILGLRSAPRPPPLPAAAGAPAPETGWGRAAWALVFASGFLAIGYEIVWFRVIGVLVKDSPYAFATVLSVYLFGVAAGSLWIRPRLARVDDPRSLFFFLQFLLGLSTLVGVLVYYQATLHTPFGALTARSFAQELHPPAELLGGSLPWFERLDVLFWPAFFVLVPTCFMGASFPLVVSLAYRRPGSEGSTVGTLYAWNLLGNLSGGAVTGLLLLPRLGTERVLLGFSLLGVLAVLLVARRLGRPVPVSWRVAAVLVSWGAALAYPGPGDLYRAMHVPGFAPRREFLEEGLSGVVVTRTAGPRLENHINGTGHGGRPLYTFVYEALETRAHAPAARRALLIGFGTGTIAETLLAGGLEEITLVEINETLLANLRKIPVLRTILEDDRLEVVIDDARRFLLRSDERFDLILMDPLLTTTAYSNNIYSREFFELVRDHLDEDGVFFAWTGEFRVIPRTVASVFEHVRLYSIFLLASSRPLERDDRLAAELLGRLSPSARRGVAALDIHPVAEGDLIRAATDLYPLNRDWRPVCEYYLGLRTRERLGWLRPTADAPPPLGDPPPPEVVVPADGPFGAGAPGSRFSKAAKSLRGEIESSRYTKSENSKGM
jgi:predicted membrane-bound spermidine synthase